MSPFPWTDFAATLPGTALTVVAVLAVTYAVAVRAHDGHEDPRYMALLGAVTGNRDIFALRRVYLPQGMVMFFVSLPVQVGMFATGGLGWLALLGVLLWLTGFFFEAVGDWQLQQFKRDPRRRGTVLDTGLWRLTRHPTTLATPPYGRACS